MMVSHSSVTTTKVMRMLGLLEIKSLHRFIIGLMWLLCRWLVEGDLEAPWNVNVEYFEE